MRELHHAYNWMTAAFVMSKSQRDSFDASEMERRRILDGAPPEDTSAELERLTAEMEARRKKTTGKKRICDMSVGTVYSNFGENNPSLRITAIDNEKIYYNYSSPQGMDSSYCIEDFEMEREIISEPTPEVGDLVQCLKDDARSEGCFMKQYGETGTIYTIESQAKKIEVAHMELGYNWPIRSLRIIKKGVKP